MESVPIIFIHIGNAFPYYLHDAVAQARLWNPTNPIHVIVDLEFSEDFGADVELINVSAIPPSEARTHFNVNTRLNTGFRDGFWKYATERLLVLADYLEFYRIDKALHLENDNMLYASLETDLGDLFEVPGLRSCTFYDHRVLFRPINI